MNAVRAIAWKELRIALDTPLGYVAAVGFLLASGFFFGRGLFLIGQAQMRSWFEVMPLLLMFFVPAVCMRLIADELRDGTFELLATQPVAEHEIVLGKYLGAVAQLALWLALTLLYPASLWMLADPDLGAIAAGYLALFGLAAVDAAVCLFASTLTRHAVVAYVVGFGILFALWLMQKAAALFSPQVQDLIAWMSPLAHYEAMLRGVVGAEDLAAFVAWSGAFLAAAWLRLEARRWA